MLLCFLHSILKVAIHIRVQVLDMKEMLLHKRIGLFHVDITQFQKDCLPFPEKVLEAVGRHLPVMAAKRNDVLLNVIKVSICFTSSFCFFFFFQCLDLTLFNSLVFCREL